MLRTSDQIVSLQSSAPAGEVALCAAVSLPRNGDAAPEWINLVPAGATIQTMDDRGPYRVDDAERLVQDSLQHAAGPMVIDENHATDLLASRGQSVPARGWIVDLDARADGIWGKVEWTPAGQQLMAEKAYRYISPVIRHRKDGTVTAILRASLVNTPNLRGLAALQTEETSMDFMEKLRRALGLSENADEAAVLGAVSSSSTALQSARSDMLGPIAEKLGLQAGADQAAVLAGIEQLAAKSTGDSQEIITGLQSQLVDVTTRLNVLTEAGKKEKAEAFVDGAIREGRVGVKPMRDRYVSMHMERPVETEELINAMPTLGAGNVVVPVTPPAKDGEISLNAEQRSVAKMLGIDPKDYAETLKVERAANEEAL